MNTPLESSEQKYPFKPCRLVDYGGDLTEYWYIQYYIYNVDKKKLQRKIFSSGINDHDSKRARRQEAEEAIKVIDEALKNGATAGSESLKEFDKKSKESEEKGQSIKGKLNINELTVLGAIDYACKVLFVGYSKHTKRGYNSATNHIKKWLTERGEEHLLLTAFESSNAFEFSDYLLTEAEWKDKKDENKIYYGLGKKTHNNIKNYIGRIFEFYHERYPKVITYNPFKVVRNKKTKSNNHKPYTPEQLGRLRKEMVKREEFQLLLFVQFIYYGFFRPNTELRLFKVSSLKEKTIFVPPHIAKNENGAHVKIAPQLEKLIQEYKLREYPDNLYLFSVKGTPGDNPVHEKYFYNRHKPILEALGFEEGFDLYGYKHTGNIRLYQARKDIMLIMKQNRHSSLEMTHQYLRDLGVYTEDEDLDGFPGF